MKKKNRHANTKINDVAIRNCLKVGKPTSFIASIINYWWARFTPKSSNRGGVQFYTGKKIESSNWQNQISNNFTSTNTIPVPGHEEHPISISYDIIPRDTLITNRDNLYSKNTTYFPHDG